MIIQTAALRMPAVRSMLRIPQIPRNLQPTKVTFRDSFEYLKKSYAEKKQQAMATQAKRR